MNEMSKPDEALSPVGQAEKRRWSEYHALLRDDAKAWRRMAFGLAVIAAAAGADDIHKTGTVKTIPFVVEVNKLGESLSAYELEQSQPNDPRVIKAQLADWVSKMRTVLVDQDAQRRDFIKAYAWIDANSAASRVFVDWFNSHSEREQAKNGTVQVEIETVTLDSPNSWRVDWSEQKYTLKGETDGAPTYHYAILGVAFNPPITEEAIRANPIGLYIETLQWGDRAAGKV